MPPTTFIREKGPNIGLGRYWEHQEFDSNRSVNCNRLQSRVKIDYKGGQIDYN